MKGILKALVFAAGVIGAVAPVRADIHIGVILSLTGPAASLGIPERNAAQLWPKRIGNEPVRLTILDDASDPTNAATAARKLVTEGVDVIVGPSITPTTLAILDIAAEARTPVMALAGGGAIVQPMEGSRRWAFKMPPNELIPVGMVMDHMKKNKASTLGFIGAADAYGETFLRVIQKLAEERGIKIVAVERFNSRDTSVTAQVLKLTSAQPDAVYIVASGSPAAMPQIELAKRGYKGLVYQTQAIANNEFLRIGGKDVDGAYLPVAPLLVAEQLPDSNPIKAVALEHLRSFEGQYGPGSRSLFAGAAWDAFLFLDRAGQAALKVAKPGTVEFRSALRDALEQTKELVGVQGVFNMSPTDHNGTDERSQVMIRIDNGKWRLVQ
jgi:branched-chain amino acid transport system substrate-binding protein